MLKISLVVLLLTALVTAEEKPNRVAPSIASQNLVRKVEPTVPPLAKTMGLGGTVSAEIVINSQGKVSSVKLLSGHPMLAPAFIDAVRKWEYKPFLADGRAVAVSTTVEWTVVTAKHSKAEEKALQDYYPAFDGCYKLAKEGKSVEAEKKCNEAVILADQLPQNRVLERSSARTFLGHALFQQHRYAEAVPLYEKAVEIRKSYENSGSDADFASENANLARVYAALGQFDKADDFYSNAVTIFEAAIVSLPDMKDNYVDRLKQVLLEYSKLKTAQGQQDEAAKLQDRAAQLQ
jgi:TonB family protein